ncbi:hypothetical protein [Bacillus altitudinis]|nr:hypothetical protein [Bacillus altitudinis]
MRKIIDEIEIEKGEVFKLKICSKGRYGVRMMMELGKKDGEGGR